MMKSWIVSKFSHAFHLWPFRIWGNFLFHYPYLIFSLVLLLLKFFSYWTIYTCKLYQSLLKVTQRSPVIFSEFSNSTYSSIVFCLVLTLPSDLYSLYLLCVLFSSYKWRISVPHFRADHVSQNKLVCCVLPWQWMQILIWDTLLWCWAGVGWGPQPLSLGSTSSLTSKGLLLGTALVPWGIAQPS